MPSLGLISGRKEVQDNLNFSLQHCEDRENKEKRF